MPISIGHAGMVDNMWTFGGFCYTPKCACGFERLLDSHLAFTKLCSAFIPAAERSWMELCCGCCTARKLCSDLSHISIPVAACTQISPSSEGFARKGFARV